MTARVAYSMSVSLDGFINTPTGSLEWVDIDEEVHAWFNDRARESAAFVYGRRLYETMIPYWPLALDDPTITPVEHDFAVIFRDKPKVVFSSTLESVASNCRLERGDIREVLSELKEEFHGELDVGGATLAAPLVAANLIDVYRVVVHPVLIGGGTPFFPPVERQLDLKLIATHRFASGAMVLTYEPRR